MLDHAQHQWLKSVMYEPGLSSTAKVLAGILLTHFCQPHNAHLTPTVADFAQAVCASIRTTQRALSELESAGWLERQGPNGAGKPNCIILTRRGTVLPFPSRAHNHHQGL